MIRNPWISAADREPRSSTRKTSPQTDEQSAGKENSFAQQFLSGKRVGDASRIPPAGNDKQNFAEKFARLREQAQDQQPSELEQDVATSPGPAEPRQAPAQTYVPPAPVPAPAVAPPAPAPATIELPPDTLMADLLLKRENMGEHNLPALNRSVERRIHSNKGEISMIEGHLMRLSKDLRSFYCTSCFNGEGKTTAALMAAYGLATMSERRTLLTETNVEKPLLGKLFGINDQPGLQDLLLSKAEAEEAIIPTAYENLFVLPAGEGRTPLHDENFKNLLRRLSRNFDYIIIDGKSAMTSSEGSKVAEDVGGILIVVECERTKWEVVQLVHERMQTAGCNHLGVILNKRKFYVPSIVYKIMSRH